VRAVVTVAPDASATVDLAVGLQVHGGWLERLDLEGFDEDLALDEASPVVVVDDEGGERTPRVQVRDGGRVRLEFTRREAPRRGRHELRLRYRTALGHRHTTPVDAATVRLRWVLPAWRDGLDGASVTLDVPGGARPAATAEVDEGSLAAATEVERTEREGAGRTRVTMTRPHLPRSTSWTVAVDVDADALDPGLGRPRPTPAASARTDAQRETEAFARGAGASVAGLLLGLALWSRLGHRRRGVGEGYRMRPWVPGPPALHAAVGLGCVAASGALASASAALALVPAAVCVALGLARAVPSGAEVPPRDREDPGDHVISATRDATRRAWRGRLAARLGDPRAAVDAGTAVGACLLAGLGVLAALAARDPRWVAAGVAPLAPLAWVLALPAFFVGSRWARPASAAERLLRLLAFARALRTSAEAPAALAVLEPAGPRPRLRLEPDRAAAGLRRLTLAIEPVWTLAGALDVARWHAETEPGSAAERAIAAISGARRSERGHVVHAGETHALLAVLAAPRPQADPATTPAAPSAEPAPVIDADGVDDAMLDALLFAGDTA
jgi:hypothetical protein